MPAEAGHGLVMMMMMMMTQFLKKKTSLWLKKKEWEKFHAEHVWIIHLSLSDMASLVNYVWKKWFHFAKLKIE